MSHYSEVEIEFKDQAALVAALERYRWAGQVEVYQEAQNLIGFHGDTREQKAHIIIRRNNVGRASNDIGFERLSNGTYRAWISEYDEHSLGYDKTFLGQIKQLYGVEKTRIEAKKKGYKVKEEKLENGQIKLYLRR